MSTPALATFELSPDLEAAAPPEARGLARDGVRLMVAHRLAGSIEHSRFDRIAEHLRPGDALVVNVSRTLPAAVHGDLAARRGARAALLVAVSRPTSASGSSSRGSPPARAPPPFAACAPATGSRSRAARRSTCASRTSASGCGSRRPRMVGSVESYLRRRGGPIRYAYAAGEWGLDAYQTIFGIEPGSAEMPSAGRPFTARTLAALAARDVQVIPIVLHCGVSSLEDGESPLPERFAVSAAPRPRA